LDGELSSDEDRRWRAHLAECQACQAEWNAMVQVDVMLRTAEPPPLLPEAFTAQTVALITRKQKLRRLLSFVTGALILGLVAWVGLTYFDAALASLVRAARAVFSSRQILLTALMRTLVGLAVTIKAIFPLMLGIAGTLLLLLAPNSFFATVAVVWYARRRRGQSQAAI
jgi:anti-sigma factor RsiW